MTEKENENISHLCNAADVSEKLFWSMLKKSQGVGRKSSCFIVNDEIISGDNAIIEMWANHFEKLGMPGSHPMFNDNFRDTIEHEIKMILTECIETPTAMEGLFVYETVKEVCTNLKSGVSGGLDQVTYEHLKYGGPKLWSILSILYFRMFYSIEVPQSLKFELLLPLFKGKGTKASNKDNYRGIAMFSVFCKVFELLILRKLEAIAQEKGYFSHLQFGFQEGVSCLEASFVISESINHMIEQGSKVFSCFLDVRKAFDTIWIDGLLYKLYHELGINSKLWLVIKELYTNIHACVTYNGFLSRDFVISQGSGQGRILAPFMYKVYINKLLKDLCTPGIGIILLNYNLSAPTFADDMTLSALYPSCLNALISIAYRYSCDWRYEFNYEKTAVVTFGESLACHSKAMKQRNWHVGPTHIDERDEYTNLGVYKNYYGSFAKNIDESITKTRKKAGMLFAATFDRRRTNPMVYLKFWKQSCIPTLLFGSELWTLTPTLLNKLEACQRWFLKKLFHLPEHAPNYSLYIISGLLTIETLIDQRKLFFLARIITSHKMPPLINNLYRLRLLQSFQGPENYITGFVKDTIDCLAKYGLEPYLGQWGRVSIFPSYSGWKRIVNSKLFDTDRSRIDSMALNDTSPCTYSSVLKNTAPARFWSLSSLFPDLVPKFRTQIRLIGSFGLQGSVPWLKDSSEALCPLCKAEVEDNIHFFFRCNSLKNEWDTFWAKLFEKIERVCASESSTFKLFTSNLDQVTKLSFLVGGLELPFGKRIVETSRRYTAVSVHKIFGIRARMIADTTNKK